MFKNTHQELVKQLQTIHRENLRKNLQHRLESARTSGNTNLLNLLEAEASYLNLN